MNSNEQQGDLFLDNPAYAEFVEKFKPKHTTDDCYTPENIYTVVRDYVCRRWNIDPAAVLRPFWPGADYTREEYPPGCVVIDNPPFSIFKQITDYYARNGIRFFLFGPGLTILSGGDKRCSYLVSGSTITYANGAEVATNFCHNLEHGIWAESCPELHDLIEVENKKNLKAQKKQVAKLALPEEVLTAARLQYYAIHHTLFRLLKSDAVFVRKLDNLPQGIFGGGLLLNAKAAAEKAAALKVSLSEREMEIRLRYL